MTYSNHRPLKVLELFSGIRATTHALQQLGINHSTTSVEFDAKIQNLANYLHGTLDPVIDIKDFKTNENFDLIVAGFPCPTFSLAGKGLGINDPSGNGRLFLEVLRIVKDVLPEYVIMENVRNIISKKHKPVIDKIEQDLIDMGYSVNIQVINALDYLPQNRERVFVIASRSKEMKPITQKVSSYENISSFLDDNVEFENIIPEFNSGDVFTLNDGTTRKYGRREKQLNWLVPISKRYDSCIVADKDSKYINTLMTSGQNTKIKQGNKWRYLTPNESMRFMGWDMNNKNIIGKINYFEDLKTITKAAGNSMVVPVMKDILKEILGE